mmetsp:Transcript_12579/g.14156  ORF Transcript_12579/g.14156 Transcript_12579/m.14156 type:complete len:98 (-) Transcript_12579:242-535(-)
MKSKIVKNLSKMKDCGATFSKNDSRNTAMSTPGTIKTLEITDRGEKSPFFSFRPPVCFNKKRKHKKSVFTIMKVREVDHQILGESIKRSTSRKRSKR